MAVAAGLPGLLLWGNQNILTIFSYWNTFIWLLANETS